MAPLAFDVLILGAGASGLMAAARLDRDGAAIIDNNPAPGKKILISGGGKCNVTNEQVTEANYRGDPAFVRPVLERLDNKALLAWLEERGVVPKIRMEGQYFCTQSAKEITELFRKETSQTRLFPSRTILEASKTGELFTVKTNRETFTAQRLVVATGGLSYPSVGATGIGHEIAKAFGHTLVPPSPGLVGFTVQKEQFWFKELSGVVFTGKAMAGERSFTGNLLFAHKGISGPPILNASVYRDKGPILLDFWPEGSLARLDRQGRKQFTTVVPLPKRFTKAFLEHLELKDKPLREYKKEEWEKLETLHRYEFAPAGNFGYTKAEVTKGGVSTDQVDPATMESRIVPGLYFTGEVLDVTGELGGYNFQWAFASGWVCGEALA